MSGICGIIEPSCLPDGKMRIEKMLDAMEHRGRDARGTAFPEENIFLGCVHQADIDPQPNAKQPLVDPDSGNILLFDGEIYNFKELQAELTKHGFAFANGSDAEVFLMAYSFWGPSFLHRIRGVFAFAIWNAREKKLFAGRDPMGVMPFYYYRDGLRLVFASEVRSLLQSDIVPREIDPSGLESALAYGAPQEPFTLVNGIRALPPGCFVEKKSRESFQCIPFTHQDFTPYSIPESDAVEMLRHSLAASVRMQSFADVPMCMLFDGTLNAIALASFFKSQGAHVKAYAFSMGEELPPELADLASELDIELNELQLNDDFILKHFEQALDSYDQPSIDGIASWFFTHRIVEEGIHVALSGIGCNALFADADDFRLPRKLIKKASFIRRFPTFILNLLQKLPLSQKAKNTLDIGKTDCPASLFSRRFFSTLKRKRILNIENYSVVPQPSWLNLMTANLQWKDFTKDPVNLISYIELNSHIRSLKLRDADQLGMANGVEIRAPYMDPIFVNLMLQIPGELKVSRKQNKPLLLKVADITPQLAANALNPIPFPIQKYMDRVCHDDIDVLFHQPPLNCMKSQEIVQLWNDYKNGNEDWHKIWTIYTILRWIRKHLAPKE